MAMGAKRWAVAVSPCSCALITRSLSRRKRSRGVIWLISGGEPAGLPAASAGLALPALAMSGPVGPLERLCTHQAMKAINRKTTLQAVIQMTRSEAFPTARPQRWQYLAPGVSGAWQAGQ